MLLVLPLPSVWCGRIRVEKSVGKHTDNGRNGDCPAQKLIFQLATKPSYIFNAGLAKQEQVGGWKVAMGYTGWAILGFTSLEASPHTLEAFLFLFLAQLKGLVTHMDPAG